MPDAPVEERILTDVVDTLRALAAGADYFTTVNSAQLMVGNVLEHAENPCAIVYRTGVEQRYGAIDQVEIDLSLSIMLGQSLDDDWQTKMQRYVSDVVRILRVDCGRGTFGPGANAFDTLILGTEIANGNEGFPVAVGQVDVLVRFRHLLTDPSIAM